MQVEAAQRLGFTGKGTTICIIDTGVDIRNPTFGKNCPDGPQCRIAFGFDVETHGEDPVSPAAAATIGRNSRLPRQQAIHMGLCLLGSLIASYYCSSL